MFWSAFMSVLNPEHSLTKKIMQSLFWTIVHLFVPRLYAFTFVHCVLVMVFSIKNLQEKEVDRFYNLRVPSLNIPNSIIAWIEAFACKKYLLMGAMLFMMHSFRLLWLLIFSFCFVMAKKLKRLIENNCENNLKIKTFLIHNWQCMF